MIKTLINGTNSEKTENDLINIKIELLKVYRDDKISRCISYKTVNNYRVHVSLNHYEVPKFKRHCCVVVNVNVGKFFFKTRTEI